MAIDFPLSPDDVYALKNGGLILSGTVTLASGTVDITHRAIKGTSVPLVSYKTNTNAGTLRSVASKGSVTVTSSSGSDASEVYYIILI